MSSQSSSQACKQERRSSFFKLIDSFAVEIGTLKKEMGKKCEPAAGDHSTHTPFGLGEEVGGLFLQASPRAGIVAAPAGARDSGYDSLHRRLSILDRLMHTHAVWLQLGLSHQEATVMLQSQRSGTFVVRRSASLQRKVISVRMDENSALPVRDFPVKESQYTFSLDGSGLSFADLFRLVAFCCISRDVLPFTLKLPEAIASARTPADLEEIAILGAGFWNKRKVSGSSDVAGPETPRQEPDSLEDNPGRRWLPVRTPSELDCCQSNGALCFINPLFLIVHQVDSGHSAPRSGSCLPEEVINNNIETNNNGRRLSRSNSTEACGSDSWDSKPSSLQALSDSAGNGQKLSGGDAVSRSPPPRPPPPRFGARPSACSLQQGNMPEKISWIKNQKDKEERGRASSRLSRLSCSLGISPSSSPPNRFSISSPISIPLPSVPISLPSLSCSPRRPKASLSSSQEDAQCHLALQDNTIEQALLRAKLLHRNASRTPGPACNSPPEPSSMSTSKREEVTEGEDERVEEGSGGGQRLSDMSISTDSSDSLDFSQSSAFFLPPLHDPSPPTEADFDTHLPLSLPPCHLPYSSMEEDDEDEEDEEDEDQDYGVGLESDQEQDQDVTMVPPGHHTKRRSSTGALVLQTALQRQLRKVSGVFNTLLTPEKRAVRRVVELSRNRGSYFGCLVQDYLSYMGEGAGALQGFASGLELLQTLRQFITQMKSYLRQSSELQPPIVSLIPEDQIDRVLEKAMLKCVLKPLRTVVSAALREFQVRSGEWQELKDNLSLAKARQPQEMGVCDTPTPQPVVIEKIKQRFQTMIKRYSPEKKVSMLLSACRLIYAIMEDNTGRPYGADEFLPMLTYVLAHCNMPQLDNEILYMMELLDPSLLHGEGGYYLTSAYGAMSLIRHFQEDQAAKVLSSETRNTLHQWHRRRTNTLRAAPSIDDFQNYLRVALQELDSGCTAKTLKVVPHATVEEVCQLCAQKFKVPEPEAYGLFLVMEDSSQQLAPDTHPQKIKAELHSSSQVTHFHFVYRRVALGNGSSCALPNLNNLVESLALDQDLGPGLRLSLPPGGLDNTVLSV